MRKTRPMIKGLAFLMLWMPALLWLVPGCTGSRSHEGIAVTTWEVCYSQNPDYDQVMKEGQWIAKDPTRLFRLPYKPEKGVQYAWLRSGFVLDEPGAVAGVSLGRIYHTDKVFVNGVFCGGRSDDIVEIHYPRNYRIPDGLLKKGENEIRVFIGIYGREFGGIQGDVRLFPPESFKSDAIVDNLVFLQIPLGIIVLFVGMFVIVLVNYVPGKKGYPALIVLGVIAVWIFHLSLIFFPVQPMGLEARIDSLWICSFINSSLFILFVQLQFRVYFKTWTLALVSMHTAFILCVLLANATIGPYYPGKLLGAVNLVLTCAVLVAMFIRVRHAISKKTIAIFLMFGFIPGFILAIDILNYTWGTHAVPYFHVYSIPFTILLIILLHRERYLINRRKMEMLSLKLKEMDSVEEGNGRRSVVTAQLKHKLNSLMDHIEQNYKQSLTRDTLAEKTGLSPDYLGRMFKAHTGKKINDHINDLRVQDACRQLRTSDRKIIDIAFSVGFESLVTFNRAFMKTMKISPTEYRQTLDGQINACTEETCPRHE